MTRKTQKDFEDHVNDTADWAMSENGIISQISEKDLVDQKTFGTNDSVAYYEALKAIAVELRYKGIDREIILMAIDTALYEFEKHQENS